MKYLSLPAICLLIFVGCGSKPPVSTSEQDFGFLEIKIGSQNREAEQVEIFEVYFNRDFVGHITQGESGFVLPPGEVHVLIKSDQRRLFDKNVLILGNESEQLLLFYLEEED